MNDFIAKPVDPDTLYAVLCTWLPRTDGILAAASASPADAPRRALKKRLASVPGLDVAKGLGRLRGNEEKYGHVIALFLREHGLDVERLATALDSGQMDSAEQLTHSLKGSSGLIGAMRVAQLCAVLLGSIRQRGTRDELEPDHAALAIELRALIEGLRAAQRGDEAPLAKAPANQAQGNEALAQLEQWLENGELLAVSFARDQSRLLLDAFGESAAPLLSAVEVFDFARALIELRALRP